MGRALCGTDMVANFGKFEAMASVWDLRTVPTIVIAHTFCASRDTRVSYR